MNQSELFIFCLYPYVLTGSVFAQDKCTVINPCDTLVNSGNDFSAIVLDEAVCMIILISNRNSKEWLIKDVDFMIFWFNEYITVKVPQTNFSIIRESNSPQFSKYSISWNIIFTRKDYVFVFVN